MSAAFFDEVHARYGDPAAFMRTLKSKMSLHGVSQGALADRAGFHPTHVCRWFNGHRKPEMESMVILDEALERLLKGE